MVQRERGRDIKKRGWKDTEGQQWPLTAFKCIVDDVPSNISPLGELTEEQHLTLSNSAIRAARVGAKFWKMRVCNLLLLLIYSWYKSGYLMLFRRPVSEFLLPEPDVILSSFHTGRVWLKITTYTRLSESAHYLEKRVLSSHPNGYWNRLPLSVWQRKRQLSLEPRREECRERRGFCCFALPSGPPDTGYRSRVSDASSYVVGVTSSVISHPGTD